MLGAGLTRWSEAVLTVAAPRLGQEQQLMGPPRRFPGWVVFRSGRRAALKPAGTYLDGLGERVHPGLEPTQPVQRLRSRIRL